MVMTLLFLVFIGAAVYSIASALQKFKKREPLPHSGFSTFLAVFMFTVWFLFDFVVVEIDGQDVGVVIAPGGVRETPLYPGWHLVAPWNKVYKMDKTVWVYTFAASKDEGHKKSADAIWTPTKDGIKMGFDLSISWQIEAAQAPWIYQNVSENDDRKNGRYLWIEENIIRAKTKSALALTVSNFSPIEVYSNKRQEIQDMVFKKLDEELKPYRLMLKQVDIREVFYSSDYENAINQKKLAEQEVLRLVEVTRQKEEQLKQATINKDIAIQEAEGQAKALQIKGSSINQNPKIIQLEWINKWNGQLPTYMLGSGQNVMLNLSDNKEK